MHPDTRALLQDQKLIAFDWETTSLNQITCRILGAAIANREGATRFVTNVAEIIEVVEWMNEHGMCALIYNAKYDLGVSLAHNIPMFKHFIDVYTAVKLYDERWPRYRLNDAAAKLIDASMASYKDEFATYLKDKYGKKASFDSVSDQEDLEKLAEYANTDALCTILIWQKIQPELKRQELLDLLRLEDRVVKTLVDIHLDGVRVDRPYLERAQIRLTEIMEYILQQSKTFTKDYTEDVEHKEGRGKNKKVWVTTEHVEINLLSGLQVGKVMKMLGVTSPVKTPKGADSWSADALSVLDHPFAKIVNDYRSFSKLRDAFVVPWLEKSERDGRLHPEFNHIGATTGRMSCSQPNLQQMPRYGKSVDTEDLVWVNQAMKENPEIVDLSKRRSGWAISDVLQVVGKDAEKQINIRRAIIPDDPETQRLIKIDYQQMEVVVFAHFCADETMRRIINDGQDIHFEMAKEMGFAIPPDLEWGEEAKHIEEYRLYRSVAKGVIFGLLYGIGPRTLGIQLGISKDEAKGRMDQWFHRFPRAKQFIDQSYRDIENTGHVKTLLGRKRRLYPDEAYKAVNAIVQGSCADLVKLSLVKIHSDLWPDAVVKLVVHDEFVIQVHKDKVDAMVPKIDEIMCSFELNPKLKTEAKVGVRYGEDE